MCFFGTILMFPGQFDQISWLKAVAKTKKKKNILISASQHLNTISVSQLFMQFMLEKKQLV